jgi:hypothetical protein
MDKPWVSTNVMEIKKSLETAGYDGLLKRKRIIFAKTWAYALLPPVFPVYPA